MVFIEETDISVDQIDDLDNKHIDIGDPQTSSVHQISVLDQEMSK
jgi:hypothetical protein